MTRVACYLGVFFVGLIGLLALWTRIRLERDCTTLRVEGIQREINIVEVSLARLDLQSMRERLESRQNITRSLRNSIILVCALVAATGGSLAVDNFLILSYWDRAEESILLGQYDAAVHQYQMAVRLNPSVGYSHIRLAKAYVRTRNYQAAISELRQPSVTAIADPDSYALLGQCLHNTGNHKDAETALRQSIALHRKAETYVKLGSCLWDMGRIEDSVSEYRYAASLDPKCVSAHTHLGTILLSRGETAEGLEHLRTAVQEAPDDVAARNTLAVGYANARMWRESAEEFRAELALQPEYAVGYFNLASVLAQLGDDLAALDAYQSYLRKCKNQREYQVGVSEAQKQIKRLQAKQHKG